jgi:hypothetical protein
LLLQIEQMNETALTLRVVPELGTLVMLLSGGLLCGVAYAWRRRRWW